MNHRSFVKAALGFATIIAGCAGEPVDPGSGTGGSATGGSGPMAGQGGNAGVGIGGRVGVGGSAGVGVGGSAGVGIGGSAGVGIGGSAGVGIGGSTGAVSGSGGTSGASPGGSAGSVSGGAGNGMGGAIAGAGRGGSGGSVAGAGGSVGGAGGKSSGCGKAPPTEGRRTIMSGGMNREYVLALPNNYDQNRAYRLIFTWHWRGGNANDVVTSSVSLGPYYGLESRSGGSAIFVSPEGLIDNNVSGWANPQGRDITFLRDMLTFFNANLCIDQQRIFSTGFSYGAMMSIAVGCALGGTFRAIAPFSGAPYSGCEAGTTPVAFWGAHGTASGADGVVPIANGREGRDEFLERNGCGTATTAVSPSPCVTYTGCTAGYPVTWCEFNGGHTTWAPESQAVWDFFAQF